MIGPSYERTVAVRGRLQDIIVYQISKSVWVATGKYMGEDHREDHQAEGPTANSAAKRWQQWATYKGQRLGREASLVDGLSPPSNLPAYYFFWRDLLQFS